MSYSQQRPDPKVANEDLRDEAIKNTNLQHEKEKTDAERIEREKEQEGA